MQTEFKTKSTIVPTVTSLFCSHTSECVYKQNNTLKSYGNVNNNKNFIFQVKNRNPLRKEKSVLLTDQKCRSKQVMINLTKNFRTCLTLGSLTHISNKFQGSILTSRYNSNQTIFYTLNYDSKPKINKR